MHISRPPVNKLVRKQLIGSVSRQTQWTPEAEAGQTIVGESQCRAGCRLNIERSSSIDRLKQSKLTFGGREVVGRAQPAIVPLKFCDQLHSVARHHRRLQLVQSEFQLVQRE